MGKIILVTGGARSGKSFFAESLLKDKKDVVYIATSKICDDEMADRVKIHKLSRPKDWRTFEGNYNLDDAVKDEKFYILDCLTILTSNIMFDLTSEYSKIPLHIQKKVEDKVIFEISKLVNKIKEIHGNLVIVTNEVGYSIVPENHIARIYRDIVGKVNQRVASMCDEVYIAVCGIPMKVK